MEKIPECDGLKRKYDSCFRDWYQECWKERSLKTLGCDDVFQVRVRET